MFLKEIDLQNIFFKSYNRKNRAKRYQFECPFRTGNVDLLTLEIYQGNWQINAFEFKLSDIKKAILQAKENMKYANKSWIVVPIEKENLIRTRYQNEIERLNHVGVIGVEEQGRYVIVIQPKFKKELLFTTESLNLLMNEFIERRSS